MWVVKLTVKIGLPHDTIYYAVGPVYYYYFNKLHLDTTTLAMTTTSVHILIIIILCTITIHTYIRLHAVLYCSARGPNSPVYNLYTYMIHNKNGVCVFRRFIFVLFFLFLFFCSISIDVSC